MAPRFPGLLEIFGVDITGVVNILVNFLIFGKLVSIEYILLEEAVLFCLLSLHLVFFLPFFFFHRQTFLTPAMVVLQVVVK